MRVTFLWAQASGYMAACWRALAERQGIEISVIEHDGEMASRFRADPLLFAGIPNDQFHPLASDSKRHLVDMVSKYSPDVLVVCGWFCKSYLDLIQTREFRRTPVILGMDSPWRGTVRQRFARFRLSNIVKRVNMVVTSGDRSSEYAKRVGFAAGRIRTGIYGCDFKHFSSMSATRSTNFPGGWPRQFLFTGRYVSEKDLPTLIKAYQRYRGSVSNPWGLTCCGSGEDGRLLVNNPGVVDRGFVLPKDLASVFSEHGVLILPSKFEPWGVVLAEAGASGLPIICSTACGAGVDIVRPYYNGIVITPGDVGALARAMRWCHDHESELPLMGCRSQDLAQAYSAEAWACRWHQYLGEVLKEEATSIST